MEEACWRMEEDCWRMEEARWRRLDGGWRRIAGGWRRLDGGLESKKKGVGPKGRKQRAGGLLKLKLQLSPNLVPSVSSGRASIYSVS
jgi:hypothetical protein